MPFAKVNISDMQHLKSCANNEIEKITPLENHTEQCVLNIRIEVNKEKEKINNCIANCEIPKDIASQALERLNESLSILQIKLESTPPTRMVEVVVDYDDDGYPITELVEVDNPKYLALQSEIFAVESKISEITSNLACLEIAQTNLENARNAFDNMLLTLDGCKASIKESGDLIAEKSRKANDGLYDAIRAVQSYLDESVSLIHVPSHTGNYSPSSSSSSSYSGREYLGRDYDSAPKRTERLIPGEPGRVDTRERGNSTLLGQKMAKEFDVPYESYSAEDQEKIKKWVQKGTMSGYQKQHIIPLEMADHPVIQKIGMDMNHAQNGIPLPEPTERVSALTTHQGNHKLYNKLVRKKLNELDINQSVEELDRDVRHIQDTLRYMTVHGYPIYELHEKKEHGEGTGILVGGATEESLLRAYEHCSLLVKKR